MSKYKVETSEYKGHPTISISQDEKRVFSCGVKKAKAILDNIEAIKKFVEDNQKVDINKLPDDIKDLVQGYIQR